MMVVPPFVRTHLNGHVLFVINVYLQHDILYNPVVCKSFKLF